MRFLLFNEIECSIDWANLLQFYNILLTLSLNYFFWYSVEETMYWHFPLFRFKILFSMHAMRWYFYALNFSQIYVLIRYEYNTKASLYSLQSFTSSVKRWCIHLLFILEARVVWNPVGGFGAVRCKHESSVLISGCVKYCTYHIHIIRVTYIQ